LVGFHVGTAETVARAIVLEGDQVNPGDSGWVNFRLAHPVSVAKDDDYIVRALSPAQTLGGGRIVDPNPPPRRRRAPSVIASLEAMSVGTPGEVLVGAVARLEPCAPDDAIRASGLDPEVARGLWDVLMADGEIVPVAGMHFSRAGLDGVIRRIEETLRAYHEAFPIRATMPREELRGRVGTARRADASVGSGTRLFGALVSRMAADGLVVDEGPGVRLGSHEVALVGPLREAAEDLLTALRRNPFAPPTLTEFRASRPVGTVPVDDDLVFALVRAGDVVRVAEDLAFIRPAHDEVARRVVAQLDRQGSITVAEARDLTGTSRKYVLPFLEYLDRERFTRRSGDVRHFGTRPVPPGWRDPPHDAAPVRDASVIDAPQ
jgi:selenocysteine-specific elongation factor